MVYEDFSASTCAFSAPFVLICRLGNHPCRTKMGVSAYSSSDPAMKTCLISNDVSRSRKPSGRNVRPIVGRLAASAISSFILLWVRKCLRLHFALSHRNQPRRTMSVAGVKPDG